MTASPVSRSGTFASPTARCRRSSDVTLISIRGEICGLIGPNGSGKSTFFDCITGLAKPDTVRSKLEGQDITGWPMNRIAREGEMLRVFQKTVVFKRSTPRRT